MKTKSSPSLIQLTKKFDKELLLILSKDLITHIITYKNNVNQSKSTF
jgi:hypothetical protein